MSTEDLLYVKVSVGRYAKQGNLIVECPKCHSHVNDNQAVCPVCHKVLLLECPNCHELGDTAVCEKCGYTILVKCSKCSRINHIKDGNCKKCGFPINTSLGYQECESDEFASATITFGNLAVILFKL